MINAQNNRSYQILIETFRPLRFNSIELAGNLKERLFFFCDAIRQTIVFTREFNIADCKFIQLFALSASSNQSTQNVSGIFFYVFGREQSSNRLIAPSHSLSPAVFRQLQWSEYLARNLYLFSPPRFFLLPRPRWSHAQREEMEMRHIREQRNLLLSTQHLSFNSIPSLFTEPRMTGAELSRHIQNMMASDNRYRLYQTRPFYYGEDAEPLAPRKLVWIVVFTILLSAVVIYLEHCHYNSILKFKADRMLKLQIQDLQMQEIIKNVKFKNIIY